MQETMLIIYLVVSIALIGIILIQQGKGAEMGASFGAGGANTVFGAAGSGNVLTKTTTILAILFFAIALSISYFNSESGVVSDDVLDEVAVEQSVEEPALEAELPAEAAKADSLESAVAPEEVETAVGEVTEKVEEAKAAVEAVKEKAEDLQQKVETEAAEITEEKKDN